MITSFKKLYRSIVSRWMLVGWQKGLQWPQHGAASPEPRGRDWQQERRVPTAGRQCLSPAEQSPTRQSSQGLPWPQPPCSPPGSGARRARLCCLWGKLPANEMLQQCPSKEYLHKKALASANYQAHAAAAIREDIQMQYYVMHHDKDSFHLKIKTEERGSAHGILQRAPCSAERDIKSNGQNQHYIECTETHILGTSDLIGVSEIISEALQF